MHWDRLKSGNKQKTLLTEAIRALDDWLEHPGVFGRGFIAGAVDPSNRPLYRYPEIAGYYLSYLACRAGREKNREGITQRACRILSCQQALWSGPEPPPTRIYPPRNTPAPADWRNSGLFIFDLAMLLRGITDAAPLQGTAAWDAAELYAYADRFLDEKSGLTPVHWFSGRPADAPDQWSTRPGPYQLKALAALQQAGRGRPNAFRQERVLAATVRLADDFNRAAFDRHTPHSLCYAIEGALLAGTGAGLDLSIAGEWVATLGSHLISGKKQDPEFRRSDVIAQVLRLSCCEPCFDPGLASDLHALLMSALHPEGGLVFALGPCETAHKNVWSALFARQALDFYSQVLDTDRPLPEEAYACLY